MSVDKDELRAMHLSGTVSIPPKFPELAEISFAMVNGRCIVEARQDLSPKLVISRSFFIEDISSIFKPLSERCVDLRTGDFYEDAELETLAQKGLKKKKKPFRGILYVRENAQSVLKMTAGLTAAESAEFYPPLPNDRSVNHYDMNPPGQAYPPPPGCLY